MSASEFRNGGYKAFEKLSSGKSKNGKTISSNGKEIIDSNPYIGLYRESDVNYSFNTQTNKNGEEKMSEFKDVSVEVKNIPEMTIAYIRHIGPYQGNLELFGSLWGRMMKWAGARNL